MQSWIMYTPELHEVHEELPFLQALRDGAKDPKLFCYRHRKTGNWIVAHWMDAPFRGKVWELINLGKEPNFSRDDLNRILLMSKNNSKGVESRESLRKTLDSAGRSQDKWAQDQANQVILSYRAARKSLRSTLQDYPGLKQVAEAELK